MKGRKEGREGGVKEGRYFFVFSLHVPCIDDTHGLQLQPVCQFCRSCQSLLMDLVICLWVACNV